MARNQRSAPQPRVLVGKELAAYLQQCAALCRSDTGREYEPLPVRAEHRKYDPPRSPMFDGPAGVKLLLGLPGFAALWDLQVPERALPAGLDVVLCTCGEGVATLEVGVWPCPGGCGRVFLRLTDALLVRRFEVDGSDSSTSDEVAA